MKPYAIHDLDLLVAATVALALSVVLMTTKPEPSPVVLPPIAPRAVVQPTELLVASWYGEPYHGRLAASGERFDQEAMTCAHRSLPFGTLLFLRLGERTAIVRVTDRGPWIKHRDLDLSKAAARQLGMLEAGEAIVEVRRLS